jgi:hypothetical protein
MHGLKNNFTNRNIYIVELFYYYTSKGVVEEMKIQDLKQKKVRIDYVTTSDRPSFDQGIFLDCDGTYISLEVEGGVLKFLNNLKIFRITLL